MKRERIENLINQYFEDGFDRLDIVLYRVTIGITKNAKLEFETDRLIIPMEEYGLVVPYENIKAIEI